MEVRVARYDFLTKRCWFLAGGLGGVLVIVGQGTLLKGVPRLYSALAATIAIVGIVFVGLSYVSFMIAREALRSKKYEPSEPAEPLSEFPAGPLRSYQIGLVSLIVSGAIVLACMWIGALTSP